LIESRSRL